METIDNFWEHEKHNTYDKQCSECYREARLIKAKQTVSWDNLYPEGRTQNALDRLDYNINRNPLE